MYGLGGVANQALAIILVPIYARALGVESYGTVAILTTTLSLMTLTVTLGLPQAFFRSYLKEATDARRRAEVLETAYGLRLVVSLVGVVAAGGLSVPLALLLLGGVESWHLLALLSPIVFFDTLNLVPLSLLRAERRPRAYATVSFSRAVLGSGLIVLFVTVLELGVLGVVLGSLASSLITAAAGAVLLVREGRLRLALDRPLARHMLAFSVPLVPAAVAGWTLNLSDRYVVAAFEGREAVGLYSAGYTIGLAINALAVAPFTLAWGAAYWELSRQHGARTSISRVLTGFVALAAFLALGIAALATDIIRILLTPEFEAARYVTPFSSFAYVLYGSFTILTTGLNLESRTRHIPVIMGGTAVVSVVLNLVLVPVLGLMGAAIATLASYALLAGSGGVVSQRYYAVPWDLPRVFGLLCVGLGLSAAALLGPDASWWRIACVLAYLPVVVAARLLPPELLQPAARLVRWRQR